MSQDNKKDIQYQIVKPEACGHTIEYKMVKKEHELEKARVDEGKSATEKKQARAERNDPYNAKSGKWKQNVKGSRQYPDPKKQESKDASSRLSYKHDLQAKHGKKPSKEDLEYPMAASEKDCSCEDKTEKCECEDKEMKKREKFYIQKIQELRKKQLDLPLEGASFQDRPIKELPGALGNKLKTGAKELGSKISGRASDLASRAGNLTPNQIAEGAKGAASRVAEGAKGAASKVGQNAASLASKTGQGALGLAGKVASKAAPLARLAGPAGIAYSALDPAQIGQSATDKNFIKQQMGRSDRNIENQQYGGKNAGQYVLQNAPEGSQRNFQEKSNTEMKQTLGLPAAQAPAGTAPDVAQKYDMKNPYKVENAKNFKDAFNQARTATGGGGNVFEYGGKKYHTYTQDEFKNPEKSGVPTDSKFYKDWQAKKDVTGPGAYYANKMNPAPASTPAVAQPAAQGPAAQPAAATAAKTPNPNAKVTGINSDGSISSTLPDGRKQLNMPESPIPMPRKDQMGTAPALNEPGKVGMKIPGASVKYSEAPGFKFGDTATTQTPTSEQAEGNLKYNKNNKLNSNMG